jgi:hypothetical protein
VSSSPPDANNASGRPGRAWGCRAGFEVRVCARLAIARACVRWTVLGAEAAGAELRDGVDGTERTGAVDVDEPCGDCAPGAASGCTAGRAGTGGGSGLGFPWAAAFPVAAPDSAALTRGAIPRRRYFDPMPTIRPPPSRRRPDTLRLKGRRCEPERR